MEKMKCQFCENYKFQLYFDKTHLDKEWHETFTRKFYANATSVTWNKEYKNSQGSIVIRGRKLRYCPECGIKLTTKINMKWAKEYFGR